MNPPETLIIIRYIFLAKYSRGIFIFTFILCECIRKFYDNIWLTLSPIINIWLALGPVINIWMALDSVINILLALGPVINI